MSRNRKLVKENLHTEDVNDAYAIIAGCNCAGIKWYIVATENLATAKVLFKNERFAPKNFMKDLIMDIMQKIVNLYLKLSMV